MHMGDCIRQMNNELTAAISEEVSRLVAKCKEVLARGEITNEVIDDSMKLFEAAIKCPNAAYAPVAMRGYEEVQQAVAQHLPALAW